MEEKINKAIAELEDMLDDPDITEDQKSRVKETVQKAKEKLDKLLNIPESEAGSKSNEYLHISIGIFIFLILIRLIK